MEEKRQIDLLTTHASSLCSECLGPFPCCSQTGVDSGPETAALRGSKVVVFALCLLHIVYKTM